MTKEEFESIFSRQLEELEKELDQVIARIEYEEAIWHGSTEAREAEQRKDLIVEEIEYLKSFIHIPAYERILATSDAEIEAYKEEKYKDIDLKIKELSIKIAVKRNEIEKLETLTEASSIKYSKAETTWEKESIITEGRKLSKNIYDLKFEIKDLESEIKELNARKEKISKKSSKEIKDMLVAKLTFGKIDEQINLKVGIANQSVDPQIKLLASVDGNEEKTEALINALRKLASQRKLNPKKNKIKINLNILPSSLVKQIYDRIIIDDVSKRNIDTIDKIIDIIDQYLEEINFEKELIDNEFNQDKMAQIFDSKNKGKDKFTDEVNFGFLQIHEGKISKEEIDQLYSMTLQKEELEKKRWKTRKTKDEIAVLTSKIRTLRDELYKKIANWYNKVFETDLSKTREFMSMMYHPEVRYVESSFYLHEGVKSGIEIVSNAKATYESAKQERKEEIDSYEARIAKIEDEILAIVGPEFKREDIPFFDENALYEIRDRIRFANFRTKVIDTVKDVKTEAQKQADEKEAKLRGITLEQLMQLRAQATAAKEAQEPTNNPGGMTM